MYAVIAKHPTTLEKYQAKLSAPDSGTGITAEECVGLRSKVDEVFAKAWANAKNYESKQNEWLASNWQGFHSPHKASKIMSTGVPRATLEAIGKVLVELPPGFKLHDSLVRWFGVNAVFEDCD
jgi:2-oxoglutarate dehydrogenase E1 component